MTEDGAEGPKILTRRNAGRLLLGTLAALGGGKTVDVVQKALKSDTLKVTLPKTSVPLYKPENPVLGQEIAAQKPATVDGANKDLQPIIPTPLSQEKPAPKSHEKREWPHDPEKQYVFGKLEIPKSDTGMPLQIDMVFIDKENNIAMVPQVLPDGTVHADKQVPLVVNMRFPGVRQYENGQDGYKQFHYKEHPDLRTADLSGPPPKDEPGRRILEINGHAGTGFDGKPLEGQALSLFNDFKVDPTTNSLVKMSNEESAAKREQFGDAYMRIKWVDPKSGQQMEQLAISSMHRITDVGKARGDAANPNKKVPLTDWIDDPRGKIPDKFDDFGKNSVVTFCQRALTDNRSGNDSHWPETGVLFNTAVDDGTIEAELIQKKFAEAAVKSVAVSSQ